jgi:hypothetical protein
MKHKSSGKARVSEITATERRGAGVLLLVWVNCCLIMGMDLKKGCVVHLDAALAKATTRVLHDELPHRDFSDAYTGRLSYLNLAPFRLFGANFLSPPYLLFAYFLAWVPAVFAIAREFLGLWPAAGVTLLLVAWGVPNYAAGMPSLFCLFPATFGAPAIPKFFQRSAIPGRSCLISLKTNLTMNTTWNRL